MPYDSVQWLPSNLPEVPHLLHVELLGSHASNTLCEDSDSDIYGIYVGDHLVDKPIRNVHTNRFGKRVEIRLYDLSLFVSLLRHGDCNVHAALWCPNDFWITTTPQAQVLFDNRHRFLVAGQPLLYLQKAEEFLAQAAAASARFPAKKLYHAQRLIDQALCIVRCGRIDLPGDFETYTALRSGKLGIEYVRDCFRSAESTLRAPFNPPFFDTFSILEKITKSLMEDKNELNS